MPTRLAVVPPHRVQERMNRIAHSSQGFVYLVSVTGEPGGVRVGAAGCSRIRASVPRQTSGCCAATPSLSPLHPVAPCPPPHTHTHLTHHPPTTTTTTTLSATPARRDRRAREHGVTCRGLDQAAAGGDGQGGLRRIRRLRTGAGAWQHSLAASSCHACLWRGSCSAGAWTRRGGSMCDIWPDAASTFHLDSPASPSFGGPLSPPQAAQIKAWGADGVICGSALVRALGESGSPGARAGEDSRAAGLGCGRGRPWVVQLLGCVMGWAVGLTPAPCSQPHILTARPSPQRRA